MSTIIKSISLVATLGLFSFGIYKLPAPVENLELVLLEEGIIFPENVQTIITEKCTECHKPDARNEKARKKLQWVKVPEMNKEEQEHLIAELFEVLEDGKMPPKKNVERKPEMKLTAEETKTLLAWVEVEEKRLKEL
jgi:cytochrome c551/c552